MPVCSNCHAEQPSSEVTSCILCGYPVIKEPESEDVRAEDGSLEFVCRESSGDSREFVGGQNVGAKPVDDDLGVETTSDLMQHEAERENGSDSSSFFDADPDYQPIGESAPPPPPPPEEYQDTSAETDQSEKTEASEESSETPDTPGSVKRLSEEELKAIEQNLYGAKAHLRGNEKMELEKKLSQLRNENAAGQVWSGTVTPEMTERQLSSSSRATKPNRGTSIAYFFRNFIQVPKRHPLIPNDVLKINDREYVLRPKQIKAGYLVGGAAVVFALLLIVIAAALTPSASSGEGQLVGVVLDKHNRPYLEGAKIRFPELDNKMVESDAQGFFTAGLLPVGTYQVEYIIDGHIVQTEQASVTDDEIRMLFLRPAESGGGYSQQPQSASRPRAEADTKQRSATPPSRPYANNNTTTKSVAKKPASKSSSSSTSSSSQSSYGKVTLNANVENARFELDGSVLGAGNLTYTRIKAGRHRYRVSADGYQPTEGSFSLAGSENYRLNVSLSPVKQAVKDKSFKTDDYFFSGKNAFSAGDYQTAIADLSKSIKSAPSNADAYYYRAQAYDRLKENEKAGADYIRAAEIYQIRKDANQALTCYNGALSIDDKNITAYIGRGNLYLHAGQLLASIADFDEALRIDKRCYQAYFGLGEARFEQHQYKKAISHFKDARSVNESDPLVHQYLMLSYLALGDDKNVKKSFEKFSEIATDEQMRRFKSNQKYGAVMEVVESL